MIPQYVISIRSGQAKGLLTAVSKWCLRVQNKLPEVVNERSALGEQSVLESGWPKTGLLTARVILALTHLSLQIAQNDDSVEHVAFHNEIIPSEMDIEVTYRSKAYPRPDFEFVDVKDLALAVLATLADYARFVMQ